MISDLSIFLSSLVIGQIFFPCIFLLSFPLDWLHQLTDEQMVKTEECERITRCVLSSSFRTQPAISLLSSISVSVHNISNACGMHHM
jgi:hypothetical protein